MWPRPPVTERRDPDGRSTRVGYVLRKCGFERHCGIVSRLCLLKGGRAGEATSVVTSSRDGTLKCWDFPANETHGGASSSTAWPTPQLRCSMEEHSGWVNDAVVLPPTMNSADATRDSRRVVSASNDYFMKVWHVDEERQGAGVVGALLSLRYHVDYVTCMAYAPHRTLLVSAGLDSRVVVTDIEAAIRVWTLASGDEDQYSTSSHRSSARGLGASSNAAQRCSVGSFSSNGQYIPQLLQPPHNQQRDEHGGRGSHGEESGAKEAQNTGASVWSVATHRSASLLVCGTASCVLRGWDPRSSTRLWRLRGHTGNIRSVLLSEDGTQCISGSADRTVRLWDVGMRRCIHVFDEHHDSVWALGAAGYSCGWASQAGIDGVGAGIFSEVFSGGRDGLVLSHDLRQLQTGLVVREPSPVQALAVSADGSEVWAAAADSHVRRHFVPSTPAPYTCAIVPPADTVPPPGAAPVPMPALPPAAGDDSIAIHGTPRLTDYKVLHNKRQVLVCDVCDQLALWDVTTGQCVDISLALPAQVTPNGVASNPIAPAVNDTTTVSISSPPKNGEDAMKKVLAQVNRPVSVPTWFSCDLSLGSLSVYLDATSCFKAESDTGAPVNLGVRTLRALFETWVRLPTPAGSSSLQASSRGGSSPAGSHRRGPATHTRIFTAPMVLHEPAAQLAQRWDDDQPPGTPADQAAPAEVPTGTSTSSSFPPATALCLVGRNGRVVGYRGRLYCGFFTGTEGPDHLPHWVSDVVWNQRLPPEELCGERVMMFSLVRSPSEGALPPLANPYCMAAPRTHIRRVLGHLVRVLDFDWAAPAKNSARRPASAVSLVSRLGRCCTVPSTRGRASGEHWSPDRGVAGDHSATSSSMGTRRNFMLRAREDEVGGGGSPSSRVRIDSGPTPLPSTNVPLPASGAGAAGARREAGDGAAAPGAAGAVPDDRYVEILCNDTLVDPDMSLATVRDFIWKRSNHELILEYRRAKQVASPSSPAPPPPLLPGGGQPVGGSPTSAHPGSDGGVSEEATSELTTGAENPQSPRRGGWPPGEGPSADSPARDPANFQPRE